MSAGGQSPFLAVQNRGLYDKTIEIILVHWPHALIKSTVIVRNQDEDPTPPKLYGLKLGNGSICDDEIRDGVRIALWAVDGMKQQRHGWCFTIS